MFSVVKPFQYVAIRMPSDSVKIEHVTPNTHINLGKFGSFNTNSIIGRPFHLTYEILDKSEQAQGRQLRVVKAAELHADALLEEAETDNQDGATPRPELDEYNLPANDKSNIAIFDNTENQRLTMAEIEALKSDDTGNAKELIARIMASHTQLDQKTAFSLAKYTLRKQRKYLKRFTVLPIDVSTLTDWFMHEKDFSRVMEIRNETLSLIGSWANIHAATKRSNQEASDESEPESRYLVVDDTGGLVIAAIAERMGVLHNDTTTPTTSTSEDEDDEPEDATAAPPTTTKPSTNTTNHPVVPPPRQNKQNYKSKPATSNTITLIHSNSQPNLSLLRYFNFDANTPPTPTTPSPHPLHTHLKTLTWLQLLDPSADSTYTEPTPRTAEELRSLKSNARSVYYRKRRRWERCKSIVDETRSGGFNALIVASYTNPISILHRLVPLLAGGAQIVVYSPYVEPLLSVADAYSTAHRNAFLALDEHARADVLGTTDFPVDPTLTLGFMVQTARVRRWQVLPGRTHPLMMGKGGAEGYIASATRVLPVKGKIEARGKPLRRRKADTVVGRSGNGNASASASVREVEVEENGNGIQDGEDRQGVGEDVMVLDSSDEAEAEESIRKKLRMAQSDDGVVGETA